MGEDIYLNTTNEIRIYVACLASYNNGTLHGAWIDATLDAEDAQDEVNGMLALSPIENAEEWAIHDYEGFEGVRLSEHQGFQSVSEIAQFIEEHETLGAKLIEHFGDLDDAKRAMGEHYRGCFASVADFAEELTEEATVIPENLQYYIDYEKMARDLEINDIFVIEIAFDEHHVFWRF